MLTISSCNSLQLQIELISARLSLIQEDGYYSWGLNQIAKAVSFSINDCKLVSTFNSITLSDYIWSLQAPATYGESLSAQVVDEQLSQRSISGSLLKYLSKLQVSYLKVDEEPAIRTNTTILLGNIASYLDEGMTIY
uniref:Uncharacterized protein n=1 Tax=Salix viminalis TaxID=40686 RepID=A0A6N2NHV6_SALVM